MYKKLLLSYTLFVPFLNALELADKVYWQANDYCETYSINFNGGAIVTNRFLKGIIKDKIICHYFDGNAEKNLPESEFYRLKALYAQQQKQQEDAK